MKPKAPASSLGLLAGALSALLAATTAHAADQTWDNGATTGNWNTTEANFGGTWTTGNTAIFGGTAGSTVTINAAGVSAAGVTFNVNNDIIAQSDSNSLTLTGTPVVTVGTGLTATINAPLNGTAGVVVDGGGTVNFGGINTIRAAAAAGNNSGLNVGNTSASNTVNIANGGAFTTTAANFRSLSIGNSTFGSNIVNITTSGSYTSPSYYLYGNSAQINMGVSSSSNQLNISNGAWVGQASSGGTNTSTIGTSADANSNAILVDGVNTVYNRAGAGGSYLNVGAAGDSNTLTIQNGGTFITSRLAAGSNGGDSNVVKVTGAGSLIFTNAGTNAAFDVGSTSGSLSNAYKVEAGAKFNFTGTGTGKSASVGIVVGADSNFIQVTGVGSTMNMNFGVPLSIGAKSTGITLTAGGNSNHLDVYNGGAFLTTSPIYVGATVALGGASSTNNAINLGNGTANTATLTVGATASQFNTAAGYNGVYIVPGTTTGGVPTAVPVQANSYIVPATGSLMTQGVNLINATSTLNIENGRLFAGATGALVSGDGSIVLGGAAYISSATGFTNTISTKISGTGSLVKEGPGTLVLNNASVIYTGNTVINAGTLKLDGSGSIANSAKIVVGDTVGSTAVLDVSTMTGGFTAGSGQTLQGSGNIIGNVNVVGTLSPGNSIESLAITGNLTLANGATFAYEVNSTTLAADLQVVIGASAGNVTLDSTSGHKVYLTLGNLGNPLTAFATGTKVTLINYTGSLVGGPSDGGGFFYGASATPLGEGGTFTAGANKWTITYGDTSGGINFTGDQVAGKFINLTAGALTAVPEPGSLLALGMLVGSGAFLRSRRKVGC